MKKFRKKMDFLTFILQFFEMIKYTKKKKDGFEGQKAIIIPRKVLEKVCTRDTILKDLYITDIGYYPKAMFHYRKRHHGSEQHILIYCVDGRGNISIDKTAYSIEPGDFFIIPKDTTHVYSSDENDPWTIYWFHFAGIKADIYIKYLEKRFNSLQKNIGYSDKRIELFNTIYQQLERGYSIENIIYSNLCFGYFLGTLITSEMPADSEEYKINNTVNYVIDFMKLKINTVCTLKEMADIANISVSHLCAVFKQQTGYPPIEYFNHLKVQKACQYLMFTPLQINEIGEKIGIEDPYYFSRFFKSRIGFSPKSYRLKQRRSVI